MIVPSTTTDARRQQRRGPDPCRATLPAPRVRSLLAMPSVSAQYSIVLRVEIDHRPGMLGRVATAIGDAGGSIGSVDLVGDRGRAHAARHHDRDRGRGAREPDRRGRRRRSTAPALVDITDRTFQMHVGGKIEQRNKLPVRTRDDLSMAYTPGVARVCTAIAQGPRPRVPVHDQAQHGRRRLRRQRRARPRRHRPRGRDARDGGQGRAVQGVRRRRRVPDLPVHARTRTRSSRPSPTSPPRSAASTSRTSARRAASRSRSG